MNESMTSILTKDPERIYEGVNPSWTAFDHSRLFITGGAGFLAVGYCVVLGLFVTHME